VFANEGRPSKKEKNSDVHPMEVEGGGEQREKGTGPLAGGKNWPLDLTVQ